MASSPPAPRSLGALRKAGLRTRPLREELRANLLVRIRDGRPLFDGILGYDDTVVPAVENALLCGHDLIFLGERGQAKTRMIRQLTALLDEWLPIVAGSESHDDPFAPVSPYARQLVAEQGDETPITWVHRDDRFVEKLATPDVSIADLIGDVDPVKVAAGRSLGDELTLHFGLLPRFVQELVAELTLQARHSADVNQGSGVSVRMSIANYETLAANALRRALRLGEAEAVPRISDLAALAVSTAGKLEFEYAGQERTPAEVVGDLVKRTLRQLFDERVPLEGIASVMEAFEQGWKVEVSAAMPSSEYQDGLDAIAGLREAAAQLAGGASPPRLASAIEFVLEGLHLANRLNKTEDDDGRVRYARR